MEKLLNFVIKSLAQKPDDVKVEMEEENSHVIFTVNLDEDDKGPIIGKQGRNVKALRKLLSVIAKRENKTVSINIE